MDWVAVRIDGRGFKKFASAHGFVKPNDDRGIDLMNSCAAAVMVEFPEITCAYGLSDEFSFVFRNPKCSTNSLISRVVSLFTATYFLQWPKFFPGMQLGYAPVFDGRITPLPTKTAVRDYLSWRQVDCHINNLNNTCFWKLVESGLDHATAHNFLKGTRADAKQRLLQEDFDVSYGTLPAKYRKGSFLYWEKAAADHKQLERLSTELLQSQDNMLRGSSMLDPLQISQVVTSYCDIIGSGFWDDNAHILN